MFRLDVFQHQWVIVALIGGVVAALAIYIAYQASRPMSPEKRKGVGEEVPPRRIPVFLVLLYLVAIVYVVVYTVQTIFTAPNW